MTKRIAIGGVVLAACALLPASALADYGGKQPARHAKHAKHHTRHHRS